MLLQYIVISEAMDSLLQVSIRRVKCYKINMEFMPQNVSKSRRVLLSGFIFSCVSRDPFLVCILCSLLFNIIIGLLEGRDLDPMVFWRHEHLISTFSSFQQGQT